MSELIFESIWEKNAEEERRQVKALWRRYRALDEEARLEERSRQIVFIVKSGQGEIGGVSTVRPVRARFLNNHYFYDFRCFIAPPFRAPGLDSLLASKTKLYLEQQQDAGTKFKGLLMTIENEDLKKQRTKAIWPATEMVFAGYNSKGHHIRIGYFKGARI